ncbi:YwqG family protein [Svornostia abyssi]|uniref:YwqG family protein n=1 Tax=Svornostia abyssi TaxID=2898438 RepID=UPI00338DE4CF
MRLDRTLEGARPTLGSSRLGGSPALSHGQRWPTCKGDPMAFLGQVRLADIPADVRGGLPGRGLLAFFVYVEEEEPGTGFWLEAGRCSSAIVTRAGSAVVRRKAPKANPRMVLRPARVALRREMTIPDVDANDQPTAPLGRLNLKRRESQAYRKLRLALMPQPRAGFGAHRLGGYADTIQEDPRTYCKGASDTWRLLLQFEWDEDLGFEVADGGGVRIFARAGTSRAATSHACARRSTRTDAPLAFGACRSTGPPKPRRCTRSCSATHSPMRPGSTRTRTSARTIRTGARPRRPRSSRVLIGPHTAARSSSPCTSPMGTGRRITRCWQR